MRISTGERHGLGTSAPSSIRASLHFVGVEGSAYSLPPKLVRLVGLSSTSPDEISPIFFDGSASSIRASVHVFVYVCLYRETWLLKLKLQSWEMLIILVLDLIKLFEPLILLIETVFRFRIFECFILFIEALRYHSQ